MKKRFYFKKAVMWTFSTIAFFLGFWFLDPNLTGNVITNNSPSLSPISLIGMGLLVCSVLLVFYSVKKK